MNQVSSTPIFKPLLVFVFILFAALTLYAVQHAGGIVPLVRQHLSEPEGWQIFTDLVIALCLFLIWMWQDAKMLGRNFWLWAAITLSCGSFGPLLYLITRKARA